MTSHNLFSSMLSPEQRLAMERVRSVMLRQPDALDKGTFQIGTVEGNGRPATDDTERAESKA